VIWVVCVIAPNGMNVITALLLADKARGSLALENWLYSESGNLFAPRLAESFDGGRRVTISKEGNGYSPLCSSQDRA
jgi:hypothetical protein